MIEMRIMLVGNANHQFMTNYAYWLRKDFKKELIIDILSFSTVDEKNFKFYDSIYHIDFKSVSYKLISHLKGIRKFYRYAYYKNLLLNLSKYHTIHFHFIDPDSYYLGKLFHEKTNSKIILSIWGSDLYKLTGSKEVPFLNTCNFANVITFTNPNSLEFFRNKFNWEKNNLRICRFGLAPLENLKNLSFSKNECKESLGLDNHELVVTIGYNLSPAQQHLKILDQFEKYELTQFKDKIVLLFPITYGGTQQYKKDLLKRLNELPFKYYIYDTFLPDDQIAKIRKASDVMIQLQDTDQFSGSMQEHLYANNVVITGSWLPYETLKQYNIWFLELDKIEQLIEVLPDVLSDFDRYNKKITNNLKSIEDLSSWSNNITEWTKLYKE